jgi:hypothetical protein
MVDFLKDAVEACGAPQDKAALVSAIVRRGPEGLRRLFLEKVGGLVLI